MNKLFKFIIISILVVNYIDQLNCGDSKKRNEDVTTTEMTCGPGYKEPSKLNYFIIRFQTKNEEEDEKLKADLLFNHQIEKKAIKSVRTGKFLENIDDESIKKRYLNDKGEIKKNIDIVLPYPLKIQNKQMVGFAPEFFNPSLTCTLRTSGLNFIKIEPGKKYIIRSNQSGECLLHENNATYLTEMVGGHRICCNKPCTNNKEI